MSCGMSSEPLARDLPMQRTARVTKGSVKSMASTSPGSPCPASVPPLQDRPFLILLIAASLAFALILWPLFGAILWSTVVAILFTPVYRRLSTALRSRRTLAALATVVIILVMVILPVTLIAASLVQEALDMYSRIQSKELNLGRHFQQVLDALPEWASNLLGRFHLTTLGAVQDRLSTALMKGGQFIAARALHTGQNAFNFIVSLFVMLYLLFFLLRDGDDLSRRIADAIPLRPAHKRALLDTLTVVIRATVKGNIVVAVLQGALGGLIFWIMGVHAPLLWAALMAVLSLLPAVGAALVWLPVAIYFLATDALWKGIVLVAYGVLVIGLVDNVVRPVLVRRDTKMPDYVVLIATLGGIVIFGLNGFVIGPIIAAVFIAAWEISSTRGDGDTTTR